MEERTEQLTEPEAIAGQSKGYTYFVEGDRSICLRYWIMSPSMFAMVGS